MRSRAVEITSAVAGIVIVAVLYLHHHLHHLNEEARTDERSVTSVPMPAAHMPGIETSATDPLRAPAVATPEGHRTEAAGIAAIEAADPFAARKVWEAAAVEVQRVMTKLEQVDVRFDAVEAEFLRREASGDEDPEALGAELRARLKELVEAYNELERELVVVEGAEQAAAARLKAAEAARAVGSS